MRWDVCVARLQDASWWLAVSGSSVGYVPYNYVDRVSEGGSVVNIPRSAQAVMLMPADDASTRPRQSSVTVPKPAISTPGSAKPAPVAKPVNPFSPPPAASVPTGPPAASTPAPRPGLSFLGDIASFNKNKLKKTDAEGATTPVAAKKPVAATPMSMQEMLAAKLQQRRCVLHTVHHLVSLA
jgi:hypothetical protein